VIGAQPQTAQQSSKRMRGEESYLCNIFGEQAGYLGGIGA
jgi:hypothetical protein